MDRTFLEELGLIVADVGDRLEATLVLGGGQAFNPLTRKAIEQVRFDVRAGRLHYAEPPEMKGSQPINLAYLRPGASLEDLIIETLNDQLFQIERRSGELSALGVPPRVNPATLELTAEVSRDPFDFVIAADRAGAFRIAKARRDGEELPPPKEARFELSEFRDRRALEDFLFALFDETRGRAPELSAPAEPAPTPASIPLGELFEAFGGAALPPRSGLELLCEVRVGDERLRFAAARVQGRTFRGLLAGAAGKLWAERFELDDFPGIGALVAEVLGVPLEDVEVL